MSSKSSKWFPATPNPKCVDVKCVSVPIENSLELLKYSFLKLLNFRFRIQSNRNLCVFNLKFDCIWKILFSKMVICQHHSVECNRKCWHHFRHENDFCMCECVTDTETTVKMRRLDFRRKVLPATLNWQWMFYTSKQWEHVELIS